MMDKILLAALPTAPSGIGGGGLTIQAVVNNIFTFLLWVVGVVGVVMIVYSGFLFVISAGRPDRTKMAIQSIIYTVVGFAIAILARAIVDFVLPVATSNSNVQGVVSSGIQIFLWAIGAAAVIMLVISGLLYITSAGDPGKTKTAKDAILYAIIGLAVALLGSAVISFVNAQLR